MRNLAGYASLDVKNNRLPIVLTGVADIQPRQRDQGKNSKYAYELFAAAGSIHEFRQELIGQRLILFA